jgi:3-methyladenine DNA glycosylase AlkD
MIAQILETFRANANADKAVAMAAYMKNHFQFLGIPSPLRRELSKSFLKELCQKPNTDWPFVHSCFEQPEREFQYLALDYLHRHIKHTDPSDVAIVEGLITHKSWWDSVDGLDQIIAAMVLRQPALKNSHIRPWMRSPNLWLRRVAINHQLGFKLNTDTQLLAESILANVGSTEFFINKAIGWCLRDYARHNPAWVRQFIDTHEQQLSKLSIREARKHL